MTVKDQMTGSQLLDMLRECMDTPGEICLQPEDARTLVSFFSDVTKERDQFRKLYEHVEAMYGKCSIERGEAHAIIRDVRQILKADNAIEGAQALAAYAVQQREALEAIAQAHADWCSHEGAIQAMDRISAIVRAALAKIPTPPAVFSTEASVGQPAEASGAGGAGTYIVDPRGLVSGNTLVFETQSTNALGTVCGTSLHQSGKNPCDTPSTAPSGATGSTAGTSSPAAAGAAPASLTENWHAIEGPNGQCACGPERGRCGDRLAALFVHQVNREPTWADGMERAAELCDEDAASGEAERKEMIARGLTHLLSIDARIDEAEALASTIRAFKAAGPEMNGVTEGSEFVACTKEADRG